MTDAEFKKNLAPVRRERAQHKTAANEGAIQIEEG